MPRAAIGLLPDGLHLSAHPTAEKRDMRVFLTGGTGYVGTAVAAAFRARGHEVTTLVRSPESATKATAAGLVPLRGSLGDPDGYAAQASEADVIVHAGFEYDATGAEAESVDERAVAALLAAAGRAAAAPEGTRRVIYTSNAFLLRAGGGAPLAEDVDTSRLTPPSWRFAVEDSVLAASTATLTTAVIRLGLVYGGNGGTGPSLFAAALRHGAPVYVGDGRSRWSCIYVHDLAVLYVRIAEARAGGVFHGVDGTPLTVHDVVHAVGRAAGLAGEPERLTPEAGRALLGEHTVGIMERDVAVSTARAVALGWRPRFASFAAGAAAAYQEWRAAAGRKPPAL
jgi:nucleoside-diphosphate-sugar epimerase